MSFNYKRTIRNEGYTTTNTDVISTSSDAWTNRDCYDNTDTVDTVDDGGFWATDDSDVDDLDECMFFNV